MHRVVLSNAIKKFLHDNIFLSASSRSAVEVGHQRNQSLIQLRRDLLNMRRKERPERLEAVTNKHRNLKGKIWHVSAKHEHQLHAIYREFEM